MTSKEEQADGLGDCRFLYDDCEGFGSNESDVIAYGDSVQLWIAPKEGKAATLLADQLFSPALLLAEAIERGVVPVAGKTMVELGAGTALPSLLAATGKGDGPPTLVTITDYPDPLLMENLTKNDVTPLLQLLPPSDQLGYDILVLSDLLHFASSHDDLIASTINLLKAGSESRVYLAAGKYTREQVCCNFIEKTEKRGIEWQVGANDGLWAGERKVGHWSLEDLSARKANVNWWIGKWASKS
ncbi:hypothetical protein M407DRAFT_34601 [Tulasnella calospora MUT 4182]|uniref:Uncharacterized protein n=1 Tax=Tulasnella calospora MUT 4182 TaxID=1051891 RepID=A0A0C3Q0D6_9AGAM|nr:hypothetical protein M407DRAFT_34601 [Tulasnella calospora MUT 4182]